MQELWSHLSASDRRRQIKAPAAGGRVAQDAIDELNRESGGNASHMVLRNKRAMQFGDPNSNFINAEFKKNGGLFMDTLD